MSTIWLCTSSFGGFIAISATPPYYWAILMPLVFAAFAYKELTSVKSRKILLMTSGANLVIGTITGQIFFRNGMLSGAGVAIVLLTFAVSLFCLRSIWVTEKANMRQR